MIKLYICISLVLQTEFGFGIRCYSCVGKFDSEGKTKDPCSNPAENVGDGNVYEIDCLNTKLCWKGVTGGRIKRGCGEKRCAFIPDINMGSVLSQTCCSNDLCNRTNSNIFSKWIVYLLLFLTFYFNYFLK